MEEKVLLPRFEDALENCFRKDIPIFLGFLSEGETARAIEFFGKTKSNISFYGGFEGALRRYLCVCPDWCENVKFPISAVTFSYRKQDKLSHRDFLGSIMALGITREKVGDILIQDGRAVVFLCEDIAEFVKNEIVKVGRVGVSASFGYEEPLPELGKKVELSTTISSNRLDCVISAICDKSRNKAQEIIENSYVSVNSFLIEKPTKCIFDGDVISVRKTGRFNIVSITDISKKGRIILKYEKFV